MVVGWVDYQSAYKTHRHYVSVQVLHFGIKRYRHIALGIRLLNIVIGENMTELLLCLISSNLVLYGL